MTDSMTKTVKCPICSLPHRADTLHLAFGGSRECPLCLKAQGIYKFEVKDICPFRDHVECIVLSTLSVKKTRVACTDPQPPDVCFRKTIKALEEDPF